MSGLTNALVAQQVQALLDTQKRQTDYLTAWLGGSPTGGPNNDGRYPFVDLAGVEILVPAPATFNNMTSGPAALAVAAKAAAELARDLANGHANRANDQRILAEAARGAAVDARNLAQEHKNRAGTSEANAEYWANLARASGQGSSEDREIVEQLAEQVADNAALASQDADDAAASAALAATFDPTLYDKKSDTIPSSRLTGVIDIARIPVLPSQLQFVSSGGLSNLTTAQQNDIGRGSIVTTTDGFRYVYSGSGSKTAAASYTVLADITPAWDSVADKPPYFPSNIGNVAGLQSALDAKLSSGAAITVTNVAFNTGLLYPDGNHTVIKTGAAGAERYWRFDANGTLYALNGGIYAVADIEAQGTVTSGSGAKRTNVQQGNLEIRNDGYGPYVDFSTDAATDFHARISVPKSDGRLWLSSVGGGNVAIGVSATANSADGQQNGKVLTEQGTEQTLFKQLTFPSIANPQDSGAGAMLEVRGDGAAGTGAWMKFHRPGQYGTYFGMFGDGEFGYGGWSAGGTIRKFWTEKNFDPLSRMERFNDNWIQTRDANDRFYFASNGRSYYKSKDGHEWRNGTDGNIGSLSNTGDLYASGGITAHGNFLKLRGNNPTMYFKDTDSRSAMIHCNAGKLYVLRGSGNDSEAWESTGGGWPLEIDLENNNATFGANIYSGIDQWFRVRGTNNGIYWESWGGGWFMNDTSWLRAYNDKNIVTGGQVQMGSFTVTSDRRLKTDIVPIPLAQASQIIDATNVYEFTKGGRRMFGMIAQEALVVAPILVSEGADIHEDGDAILSLDQTGYIPVLIAEVRSLRQRVAQLEGVVQ